MHVPKTYLSLHDITGLRITSEASLDNPLVLTVDSPHGAMQITLYLQPLLTPDQILALAAAMQAAMATAEPAAVCPIEQAAYSAEDDYWRRLRRDLDRAPIEKAAE